MTSFQISISPTKVAAARFIGDVRRGLQRAYASAKNSNGMTQSDIARELGVHRSVVNRELTGLKDMTLGRVAELAHILGRKAVITFPERKAAAGQNIGQIEVPLSAEVDWSVSETDDDATSDNVTFDMAA